MAFLGEPYRIHYVARDFKSRLSDIFMYVYKPNGVRLGPYILSELPVDHGSGVYYEDFMDSDIEGSYLFLIDSVSNPARDAKQIYFSRKLDSDLSSIMDKTNQLSVLDANMTILISNIGQAATTLQEKTQDLLEKVDFSIGTPHSTVFEDLTLLSGKIDAVKSKTDLLSFAGHDIKATLDGEPVDLNSDTLLILKTILGLNQHNYRLYNAQYNSDGKLIFCLVKLYNNKDDVDNDSSPFKIYKMTSEYNNQKLLINYKMEEA